MELRPYQRPGVNKFFDRTPHRLILSWAMGAGKTYAAVEMARRINPSKALFIVPAIVRPMWEKILKDTFPGTSIASIVRGRKAMPLSKAEAEERALAYTAAWQVVSYDLVGEVPAEGWEFICIDEIHNLRTPNSKQSKRLKALLRVNLNVPAVGLSGTLIPNEAKQLWNPIDTLFPGWYGEPTKTGDVSWRFQQRFCKKEVNSHGTKFYGLREEEREALKGAIFPYTDRVVQADFAAYAPPLFVEPLRSSSNLEVVVRQWQENIGEETSHWGIFTHRRETARTIAAKLSRDYGNSVFLITGEATPEQRNAILSQAAKREVAIIVGTTHSLDVGISLSFLKQALIVEWTTAMDNMLQFLARFARQDSTSLVPTRVDVLFHPNDETRMGVLRDRIDAVNSVFKAGRSEELLSGVMAEKKMTEDEFADTLNKIVAGIQKRASTRLLIEEDEDDE